jgi:hypothetical protein
LTTFYFRFIVFKNENGKGVACDFFADFFYALNMYASLCQK